jgi:hypothetical protein
VRNLHLATDLSMLPELPVLSINLDMLAAITDGAAADGFSWCWQL